MLASRCSSCMPISVDSRRLGSIPNALRTKLDSVSVVTPGTFKLKLCLPRPVSTTSQVHRLLAITSGLSVAVVRQQASSEMLRAECKRKGLTF